MDMDLPQTDSTTDAQLMRRLAHGDMQALGALVDRHQQSIHAIAYRMTGREDLADDLTQDTFIRLYKSAGHYRPAAAFRTFLYRIVVNLCIDASRRPRLAELPEDIPAAGHESLDPLMRQERQRAIQRAMAELPERQRMAIILHRFERMTHEQIAQSTGWSRSAIESLLTRAYDRLRQRLAEWAGV